MLEVLPVLRVLQARRLRLVTIALPDGSVTRFGSVVYRSTLKHLKHLEHLEHPLVHDLLKQRRRHQHVNDVGFVRSKAERLLRVAEGAHRCRAGDGADGQ